MACQDQSRAGSLWNWLPYTGVRQPIRTAGAIWWTEAPDDRSPSTWQGSRLTNCESLGAGAQQPPSPHAAQRSGPAGGEIVEVRLTRRWLVSQPSMAVGWFNGSDFE
ncbi:hypothetical protein GCM10018775_27240 [Streptomyces umbrinus]|nr:hypothetical protein GCM10018775_27240 [Streptomyces umbrinus]